MNRQVSAAIGLVLRSVPYEQRSARAQLDVALAAAALEQPLQLYFLGDSVLQLLCDRGPAAAQLPAGYRAWASLPELTPVSAFAETAWVEWLQRGNLELSLPLRAASRHQMRADWSACHRVVVL
jgi:hypothetical protein